MPSDSRSRLGTSDIAIGAWIIGAAALAVGFAAFSNGFPGNVLAETFGIAISVAVALTVIDRLVERERERERAARWAAVEDRTLRSLKRRARNITWQFLASMMGLEPTITLSEVLAVKQPEGPLANSVRRTANWLTEAVDAAGEWAAAGSPFADPPTRLHVNLADDFAFIKAVLAPRVLALAADPRLVELLLRLEDHDEEWRARTVATETGLLSAVYAWREAAATFDVALSIVEHLEEP